MIRRLKEEEGEDGQSTHSCLTNSRQIRGGEERCVSKESGKDVLLIP